MILQNFFISLFKYNVSDLDAGNYIVRANYSGNSLYAPASVNTTLAVNKKTTPGTVINITDLGNTTAGNATLVVEVPKNLTGNITVTIGDENYTAPITNGTATVDLTNVTPGEYNAIVTYDGDDNNELVSKNITDGTNITITYNNNKFTVKTLNGYATILLQSELKPDTYKVTTNYTNITTTNNIVIKNIINAKKLKKLKKSKKVNKVKASLIKVDGKYLKGKKLTLKIKGKKVAAAKTNKKGTATFKVKKKKLKKFKKGKKYTASVIYGQDIYNKKIKIK